MLDADQVGIAAGLQETCPMWLVYWSPYRRKFTAIPRFVPLSEPNVIVDEPTPYLLRQRIRAYEIATSIGVLKDLSARPRTDAGHHFTVAVKSRGLPDGVVAISPVGSHVQYGRAVAGLR